MQKVAAWLRSRGGEIGGYAVDVELSARWQGRRMATKPLLLACSVVGQEPSEFLEERGVYRQVPLLSHFRSIVERECRHTLSAQHLDGFRLE
jgi:hypothetical protein